jgi:RNA polymerase sigma-70 factor (ECF subfamily)
MDTLDFKQRVFDFSEELYPMVYRMLGSRQSTEDAIQDIMMKLWIKRNKIKNHPNLKGFIILTARNHCIDLLRRKKKVVPILNEDIKDVHGDKDSTFEWQQLNNVINTILKKAPEQQREVFLMRDIDGYDFKEIAYALDIKIEHCRVLLSRIRRFIAKELETRYHYERGTY